MRLFFGLGSTHLLTSDKKEKIAGTLWCRIGQRPTDDDPGHEAWRTLGFAQTGG